MDHIAAWKVPENIGDFKTHRTVTITTKERLCNKNKDKKREREEEGEILTCIAWGKEKERGKRAREDEGQKNRKSTISYSKAQRSPHITICDKR